jgi:PAS domain S-box-containing protein
VTSAPPPLPEPPALFAALPDPCLLLTTDFRIAAANDAYLAAAGKDRARLVGRLLLDVAAELQGTAAGEAVMTLRLSLERVLHRAAPDATAVLTVRPPPDYGGAAEERVWRLTNAPVFDGDRVSHILHRVEDVTQRRMRERRWRCQHDCTAVLAASATFHEAAVGVVATICESKGCRAGAFWQLAPQAAELHCAAFWRAPGAGLEALEAACREARFAAGGGLPGRLWQCGQPVWVADRRSRPEFALALHDTPAARDAVAFPVTLGASFLGVVELFGPAIPRPDDELLAMMAAVGSQLGQFLQRRRTEDARAAIHKERNRLLEQLQSHVERLPLAYLVSGPDFRYTGWNPAAERLFGYREAEALGKHPFEVIVPPASRELVAGVFARMRAGDMDAHGVCANLTRDGREIICEWHNTPLFDHGDFAGILSMAQDVTERVRLNADLEDRVRARTAELQAANGELEAFSYSVSHDLRAPLRGIDGLSKLLLREHLERLPDAAREHLRLIHSNAERMGCLIDDLLKFSRLGRQPVRRDAVDTGRLVRQCLDELAAEMGGRAVEVVIGELPPCRGDRALLKQVWTNLLSNALKYTRRPHPSEPAPGPAAACAAGPLSCGGAAAVSPAAARVEIGCRRNQPDGEAVYYVRDNGVGFDMRYAGKLFGVFQRLHRAEDYEGTGVGLAIVQRVVQRHGGRVWAEAERDKGATFFFTLGVGGDAG